MCTTVKHRYSCGHVKVETAPCAASKGIADGKCGVKKVMQISHGDGCDACGVLRSRARETAMAMAMATARAGSSTTVPVFVVHKEHRRLEQDLAMGYAIIITTATFITVAFLEHWKGYISQWVSCMT